MDLLHSDHRPAVVAAMTPFPYYVEADDPVAEAERIMREHGVRHVPVQEHGQPVGLLSERDVAHHVNPALGPAERQRIRVGSVCRREDLFVVDVGEPLDRVLQTMAERQLGSALVVKRGKLAGIFTVVDACRLFAGILRERYDVPDDAA